MNKQQDMHKADIIALIKKSGTSLSALSIDSGLHPRTLANALVRSYPKAEKIIADAVGLKPEDIWPARYLKKQVIQIADEKVRQKVEAVKQLHILLNENSHLIEALNIAAEKHSVSVGSLKNWYYKVQKHPIANWENLLTSKSGMAEKPQKKAVIEQQAWDYFLAYYLTPKQLSLKECYENVVEQAKKNNWAIASIQTFKRRLFQEFPAEFISSKRNPTPLSCSTVGSRLKEERNRLQFTQEKLGALGGVEKQTQLKYESNESSPNAEYLSKIAKAGADIQYIVLGQRTSVPLNAEEQQLLDNFRKAEPSLRQFLLRGGSVL